MSKNILSLLTVLVAIGSSVATADQFPITCKDGGYPRIVEYFNQGVKAGYDVFKTADYVEATTSKLSDAKKILTRLCGEKAALERN